MKKKVFTATISLSLSILLITGVLAFAGPKEIKARIKARLSVINALKADGIIGENNRGYLEFIGSKKPKADVVSAENSDRKQVYSAIAKQQGVTADLVGKRRAKQIAQRANPGHWVQNGKGNWYQKK
jgi:uncharacterized protein YdbL (DUF1318 family)